MKRRRRNQELAPEDDGTTERPNKRAKNPSSPVPESKTNGHLKSKNRESSSRSSLRKGSAITKDENQAPHLEEEQDEQRESTSIITPKKIQLNEPSETPPNDVNDASKVAPSRRIDGKRLFLTPTQSKFTATGDETPKITRNADRSARRKSTRNLIERTLIGDISENEEDEAIARHIYESDEGEDVDREAADTAALILDNAPDTPSKRRIGRPKGSKNRERSPTPPLDDLPPHEKYFFQNRGGRVKTSDNTLASLALLDHEEYFSLRRAFNNPHTSEIKALQELHSRSFNQWLFELSQDFNICAYGWGSKRSLLLRFADHIYKLQSDEHEPKIVIINGYAHNLTIRDVLNTIAGAISSPGQKMGAQPAEMVENVIGLLEEDTSRKITLIVHSIDRVPLRRAPTQAILSRLAAHPQIHLIASADHPSFPLLWDSSLRSTYNFLFHDCTTFEQYTVENDVVEEVHELLGRSGRRVGGKEGVIFVLKSLPENAKNLFRVLIGEQLISMDGNNGRFNEDDDDGDDENDDNDQQNSGLTKREVGVEYRVLYQKAVEEFICSNEMNFRTLLKEFHDHQIIKSRKNALGTEILSIPFRKEELETMLEDIAS